MIRTKSEILKGYEAKASEISQEINKTKSRGRLLLFAQLTTFVIVVMSVVAYTLWHEGMGCGIVAAISVLAYLLSRYADGKNSERADHLKALLHTYMGEIAYLDGNFSAFYDGERYLNPHHEFSFDLDIFGPQSLFHRINRSITRGGSDRLAECCSLSNKTTIADIANEREAINEMAELSDLRMEFMALTDGEVLETNKVYDAFDDVKTLLLPKFATSGSAKWLAIMSVGIMAVLTCWSAFGSLPSNVPLLWGLMQTIVCLTLCGKHISEANKVVGEIERQTKGYAKIMRLIASHEYSAKLNKEVAEILSSADGNALQALKELTAIIDAIDRRGHALYMVLADALVLNDLWLARRFAKWKQKYQDEASAWIDAVSIFDTRVSMATFRYNEPRGIDATIVDEDKVVYDANDLYHPFLGDKAVANDFNIQDGNYYIVTGANMAGKSTFLRSVGINYILALCGMPVFASNYRVSLFSLFSSMRTSDDLAHGISYFNAELLRLKQLIDTCRENSRTLIILDEILKGTNSADKLNGSRMFLEAMSKMPVTGIIATHDLELSKMADQYPQRFHNYCFEIELGASVTYSYKITPGVARNQNATFLLKEILK